MCDKGNTNPFASLFGAINEGNVQGDPIIEDTANVNQFVERPVEKEPTPCPTEQPINNQEEFTEADRIIADIFGLTMKSSGFAPHQLVFLNTDSVEHAVFERLMLPDPKAHLLPKVFTQGLILDSHVVQMHNITYLYECYSRLFKYNSNTIARKIIEDLELQQIILRNVGTALQEPDLFPGQEVHQQFVALYMDGGASRPELTTFLSGLLQELTSRQANSEEIIQAAFMPIIDILYKEISDSTFLVFRDYWFYVLQAFAAKEPLAKLILAHNLPRSQGKAFANTIIGALLNLSCLPKTIEAPYEFFEKPLQQSNSAVEGNVWTALDTLSEYMHKIVHTLLKCSAEVRHMSLQWIGNCLHANASRGKIWNSHVHEVSQGAAQTVSDGFMLNLGNVLLKLCEPFCKINGDKILRIDPTYCAVEAKDEKDSRVRGVHLKGMSQETCMIPTPEGEPRPMADSFTFVTECFFMTHRALDLGYRVVIDKLFRTTQDLSRIQRAYNEMQNGGSPELYEVITQRMEMEMSKYLSLRASLLPPEILMLLTKFHATTAVWLMQINLDPFKIHEGERNSYGPKQYTEVTFPLPETVPDTIRCIPEFVVENTVGFLIFLHRLSPNTFEEQDAGVLNPILTEVIALMESPTRLYNPHLRARLAEGLEALLPIADEGNQVNSSLGTFRRQELFINHPHRQQIVTNLLHVFVSIEMTGQSVQFEQKFNYRRPMYVAMDYLWKSPEHRNNFKYLAAEAEANMEAVQPPLFLSFINLLMNDAVFLLDEALSNMVQLRKMQDARDSGEWNRLPQNERDQQQGYLQHIGMIARFDNILGRETISTIKMLTAEIRSIFCHPTMVDRIAQMLNYLLLQLVGPDKKKLKVKDQKEYEFNPAQLVLNICEIYINLSDNKNFVLAVSQDGRSYRPDLFKLAEAVLVRIGGGRILGHMNEFDKKVENAAKNKMEEDEILSNAPDEFLDPIMNTLMTDPVQLPSSRMTVDRQTIARHLLSDQTDPFNRSPLTMDMVTSDVEMRNKIQEWIAQKKGEQCSTSAE